MIISLLFMTIKILLIWLRYYDVIVLGSSPKLLTKNFLADMNENNQELFYCKEVIQDVKDNQVKTTIKLC